MFALNSQIHCAADARLLAKRRLPWMVFDYIDGAAGEEFAERNNRQALQELPLYPRVLNNVEHRDSGVDVLGKRSELPFGISPMGMCNLSRPGADLMLARMAAKHGCPVGVSTAASTSLERMIETADGNAWFQLYFSGNLDSSLELLDRAKVAGYQNLILTVDVPEVGRRPRELRRGFSMPFRIGPTQFADFALHPSWSVSTLLNGRPKLANFGGKFGEFDRTSSRAGADWQLLDTLRNKWQGKLIIKGVLDASDALRLQQAGVDAIQVSSHGGRQLDSAPPAIRALQHIRNTLGNDFPLFYDSGLRSGEDILKAYSVGADYVFFGRPLLFAIAANGEAGLSQLCDVLSKEASIALAQLGKTRIGELRHQEA